MATSTLTISSTPHNLKIQEISEENSPIINERSTLVNPDDYDGDNAVLSACGLSKRKVTINGYCDLTDKATYLAAMKNNTKVYPVIYPNNGSTNIIETSAYYYITNFSGSFQMGDNYYWYSMSLIYGGS